MPWREAERVSGRRREPAAVARAIGAPNPPPRSSTLYIDVTANLARRIWQHRSSAVAGCVQDYSVYNLVFAEFHETMADAILHEKRIKKWRRA